MDYYRRRRYHQIQIEPFSDSPTLSSLSFLVFPIPIPFPFLSGQLLYVQVLPTSIVLSCFYLFIISQSLVFWFFLYGSSNIGHLEAVVRILQHPFVKGVSRVCKPVSLSPPLASLRNEGHNTAKKSVHVDIVCTLNGNPVWFLVSARNPKFVSWDGGACQNNKGLRTRIQQVVDAAAHSVPSTKPYSIILFFSNGLDESVRANLEREFGASELGIEFPVSDFGFSEELEDGWIYIHERSLRLSAYILEIKVDQSRNSVPKMECGLKDPLLGAISTREDLQEECLGLNLGASFCSLISRMKPHPLDLKDAEFAREKGIYGEGDMINFDTTALIALVSGISNGGTEKILSTSERELRLRFKSNYEFVIAQVFLLLYSYICTLCHLLVFGNIITGNLPCLS